MDDHRESEGFVTCTAWHSPGPPAERLEPPPGGEASRPGPEFIVICRYEDDRPAAHTFDDAAQAGVFAILYGGFFWGPIAHWEHHGIEEKAKDAGPVQEDE